MRTSIRSEFQERYSEPGYNSSQVREMIMFYAIERERGQITISPTVIESVMKESDFHVSARRDLCLARRSIMIRESDLGILLGRLHERMVSSGRAEEAGYLASLKVGQLLTVASNKKYRS